MVCVDSAFLCRIIFLWKPLETLTFLKGMWVPLMTFHCFLLISNGIGDASGAYTDHCSKFFPTGFLSTPDSKYPLFSGYHVDPLLKKEVFTLKNQVLPNKTWNKWVFGAGSMLVGFGENRVLFPTPFIEAISSAGV